MGKLFGTDGIRGVVNAGLDADLAYKVGLAAAEMRVSLPMVTTGFSPGFLFLASTCAAASPTL